MAHALTVGTRELVVIGGHVGIGITSPAAKLDIEGSGGVILNAGNVGIGSTSPAAKLDVAGTIAATNLPQRTSANITTGTITCDGGEKTQTSMNFTGIAGQKVEIRVVHGGRLNATGHHYNQLYLDATLVDSAGVYSYGGWRSHVTTVYTGTLSSSGTHNAYITVACGSGATSMTDVYTGEYPNGGLHYVVWVGG